MEKGGVIVFLIALAFAYKCQNDTRQYSGRAVLNAPTAEQAKPVSADLGAVAATKDVAQKIAAATPLVMEALKECPKPIPPEMITAFWARENDYCPGMPIKKCDVSKAGAIGPTQIMPFNIKIYGKPGEDPETLAVGFKLTVRHLCFAKGKDNIELDPASDAAILRYNNDGGYLKDIRRLQASHAPVWASIRSGNGSVLATNIAAPVPVPPGCEKLLRGGVYCPGAAPKPHYFPAVPLAKPATWFSSWGDRRNHVTDDGQANIVPHGGIDAGCATTGEPILAACDGKVVTAAAGIKRAGSMVAIECGNEKVTVEHMDTIGVAVNQTVTAGQRIGGCGHTGNAEPKPGEAPAPHAHIQLAVREGNGWKNVNPCAAPEGITVLHCDPLLIGPNTRLNPIHDVDGPIASN